jgi:hypothetical protein
MKKKNQDIIIIENMPHIIVSEDMFFEKDEFINDVEADEMNNMIDFIIIDGEPFFNEFGNDLHALFEIDSDKIFDFTDLQTIKENSFFRDIFNELLKRIKKLEE